MRKEESHNRARLFAMRGHTYFNKSRQMWTCCPLWDWTGDDIWAYTVINNLPYSEIYDAFGYDRRTIRNGVMIGGGEARWGAYVFFRRLYPDLWRLVCKKYPHLRSFG